MKSRRLATLTTAAVLCLGSAVAAGPALAVDGLPVVAHAQPPIRWHTGPNAYMTIDLHIFNATSVSVQMTGFVYGSTPRPGLHLYKRTRRFSLTPTRGDNWSDRRTDEASIGAVMSDQTIIAVRACNAAGCLNTVLSYHLPGE